MMKRTFSTMMAVLTFTGLLSGVAEAHSALVSSVPADKAKVAAPEQLVLTFGDAVRLVDLKLVHGPRHEIDFGFEVNAAASNEFGFALPELMMGQHTVTWTIVGDDGHTVSDSFTFTNGAEGSAEMPGMAHGAHQGQGEGRNHGAGHEHHAEHGQNARSGQQHEH
jgi:methionine-rich copper-binding protein CopC